MAFDRIFSYTSTILLYQIPFTMRADNTLNAVTTRVLRDLCKAHSSYLPNVISLLRRNFIRCSDARDINPGIPVNLL
jgi:hypothetical protein